MNSAPYSIELLLAWLIDSSGITNGHPHRRLNAIENQITAAAKRWRDPFPVVPDRDLRMSTATRDALLNWVQSIQWAIDARTRARLDDYSSSAVVDSSLRDGWIRLLLVRASLNDTTVRQ